MKITEPKIINNYLKILTFNNKNSLNLEDDVFYDPKKKIISGFLFLIQSIIISSFIFLK